MAKSNFENLLVYRLSERLADDVWDIVVKWPILARDTVGKQLIRAADSIGANMAEGDGRGTFQENRRFNRIPRGSLYEAKHFLRRAFRRKLLSEREISSLKPVMEELAPRLNAYLKGIGTKRRRSIER
jgi:four helix bundle protein